MNFSKQTSQFDTCLNDHGRMPEWKTAYLTTPVTASMISLSVVNLLVSPCTIFLNALVMIAVKTSARMKSNYHILLASLAFTDLMTGALAQPLVVAVQLYRLNGDLLDSYQRNNCLLEYIAEIAGVTFVIASMQHLALLSVERFVARTYPYQYPEIITKRRLISSAIFAWSFAALSAGLSVNSFFTFIFRGFLMVASISILVFCHISVYREARAQMRKIKSQQVSRKAREVFFKEKKADHDNHYWRCSVLISTYDVTTKFFYLSLEFTRYTKLVKEYACRSLLLCNSACNPLIYCARNREFRKAFKRLLRRRSQIGPT